MVHVVWKVNHEIFLRKHKSSSKYEQECLLHSSVWAPCDGRRGITELGAKSRCSCTAVCKLHGISLICVLLFVLCITRKEGLSYRHGVCQCVAYLIPQPFIGRRQKSVSGTLKNWCCWRIVADTLLNTVMNLQLSWWRISGSLLWYFL